MPGTGENGKSHALTFAVVVTMFVTAAVLGWYQFSYAKGYVTIGGNIKVRVSVAATDALREKGLGGRAKLASDEGMLFLFDRADTYLFWMKDMRFPIDILWLKDGQIADITADLPVPGADGQLPTFGPRVPVDRVLEVQAGFAKAHGLKLGMPVEYHVDSLKDLR